MKPRPSLGKGVAAVAALLWLAWAQPVAACATCFGKSDSKLAEGLNMGIFALLAMVLLVLGWLTGFFIYLSRRAAKENQLQAELASTSHSSQP